MPLTCQVNLNSGHLGLASILAHDDSVVIKPEICVHLLSPMFYTHKVLQNCNWIGLCNYKHPDTATGVTGKLSQQYNRNLAEH